MFPGHAKVEPSLAGTDREDGDPAHHTTATFGRAAFLIIQSIVKPAKRRTPTLAAGTGHAAEPVASA